MSTSSLPTLQDKIRYRIFIVCSKADHGQLNLLNCTITEKYDKKLKNKNLRSTGSRQEAVESVLRKEKRVCGGNDLRKRGFKLRVKERGSYG